MNQSSSCIDITINCNCCCCVGTTHHCSCFILRLNHFSQFHEHFVLNISRIIFRVNLYIANKVNLYIDRIASIAFIRQIPSKDTQYIRFVFIQHTNSQIIIS
eukprot:868768_1